ncbi:hypothetical protein BUALT_Bualt17G0086000 [Buddleja alternifolia]|uniref:Uncharacterized protein n=1 Tax=Buddleja alternifolia TaxID=168488 RepID=A0AAV6WHM5_9LAMI|nr:hypothetical protein BUALT_Bualt17G0086000 [Buddleja alternifolia]
MFASRLLNILQTVPSDVEYETCVFDLTEEDLTMKENENATLGSKDTSPRPPEVKGKDESWNAKFADDLDNENRARDSPRKEDTNPFTTDTNPFTTDTNPFTTDTNPFTDKNVLECELPELVVCYKESDYHVVKDICVDEGMPVKDKILIDSCDNGANQCESKNDNDGEILVQEKAKSPLDSSLNKDSGKNCDPEDSVQTDETNSLDEGSLVDKKLPIQEFGTRSFLRSFIGSLDDEGSKAMQLPDQIPYGKSLSNRPNATSTGAVPKEDVQARSLLYNSEIESGSITFNFNAPEKVKEQSVDSGVVHDDQKDSNADKGSVHEQPSIIDDGKSDDSSADGQVQSGDSKSRSEENVHEQQSLSSSTNNDEQAFEGESSFAVGRVTYSGPISFSGSVSLRSEGSATSGRSFAFPVLQNEWNSSPVRMAKAERRRFRKHKGWRSGLLCCRF